MKRTSTKSVSDNNGMRAEYDFTGGVRGKHYRAMQAGYTITIHKADGTVVVKDVRPKEDAIVLELDVQEYFPDSESVNAALRSLIKLIPKKRTRVVKKARTAAPRRRVASGSRSKPRDKKGY